MCYYEENICKKVEIPNLLMVLLYTPLNKLPWSRGITLSTWIILHSKTSRFLMLVWMYGMELIVETKFQKMSVKVSPGNSDQKFLKISRSKKNLCNSVICYYSVSSLVFFHAITCFLKRSNRINVLTQPNEVISM